jgi:hypothetical protein
VLWQSPAPAASTSSTEGDSDDALPQWARLLAESACREVTALLEGVAESRCQQTEAALLGRVDAQLQSSKQDVDALLAESSRQCDERLRLAREDFATTLSQELAAAERDAAARLQDAVQRVRTCQVGCWCVQAE